MRKRIKIIKRRIDFDKYDQEVQKLLIRGNCTDDYLLARLVLGVNGEAGELAEKVKKIMRDATDEERLVKYGEMKKELGDILFYLSAVAAELGSSLKAIALMNLTKLKGRKERGTLWGDGDNR